MVLDGEKMILSFENMQVYREDIIFPDGNSNEIYLYNHKTGVPELFCKIDAEADNKTNLFGGVLVFEKCCYVYPMAAQAIYKIQDHKVYRIDITNELLKSQGGRAKFVSAHIWNRKIYLIGTYAPIIMIYDVDCGDIEYINYGIGSAEIDEINTRQSLLDDGKIYIPVARMNRVIVFDTETKQVEQREIGGLRNAYISISKCGDILYLVPKGKGNVIWWNEANNKYGEIEFPADFRRVEYGFSGSVTYGGYVWLFPMNAEGIWKIDIDNCLLKQCEIAPLNISKVFASLKYKEKLLFFSNSDYQLYVVDEGGASVNTMQMILSERDSKDYTDRRLKSFFSDSPITMESDVITLKHFLYHIENGGE